MLRIECPYCGLRDHEEFCYFGDATMAYPALLAEPYAANHAAWVDTVYTRNNPKGLHTESWQHTPRCRRRLVVQRNPVSPDIASVVPAAQRTLP
jgi:sarcosine oxidase subunit delta